MHVAENLFVAETTVPHCPSPAEGLSYPLRQAAFGV